MAQTKRFGVGMHHYVTGEPDYFLDQLHDSPDSF
jgi:hypothetical protein